MQEGLHFEKLEFASNVTIVFLQMPAALKYPNKASLVLNSKIFVSVYWVYMKCSVYYANKKLVILMTQKIWEFRLFYESKVRSMDKSKFCYYGKMDIFAG